MRPGPSRPGSARDSPTSAPNTPACARAGPSRGGHDGGDEPRWTVALQTSPGSVVVERRLVGENGDEDELQGEEALVVAEGPVDEHEEFGGAELEGDANEPSLEATHPSPEAPISTGPASRCRAVEDRSKQASGRPIEVSPSPWRKEEELTGAGYQSSAEAGHVLNA
ncbi:hypothetical protein CSOJ01_16014 [Colletotrichum sojae]|uniref:Uncharacterized protein n=1 Tax=Colletotrichum sojae TaxID=2175907 RepID=A0A8H6IM21_9PEZI|nr:hypothetical protein CSOJ01_16014 [Colletotrichum sojae]